MDAETIHKLKKEKEECNSLKTKLTITMINKLVKQSSDSDQQNKILNEVFYILKQKDEEFRKGIYPFFH